MITLAEYMTCGGVCYVSDVSEELLANARRTVDAANAFVANILPRHVPPLVATLSSGYRSAKYNESLRARGYKPAKRSKHMLGLAIDLDDDDGLLDAYCLKHRAALERHELWFEHPSQTKGWCHLQIVPYASYRPGGPRWFYP